MVKIPVKFRRIADAFDEAAREIRSCDSSGSEHSAADLSDLVNSFLERGIGEQRTSEEFDEDADGTDEMNDESDRTNSPNFEFQNSLEKLFDRENHEGDVTRGIQAAVEKALEEVSGEEHTLPNSKRRLMAWMRDRGFDAGLCKSKWEKNGHRPSGDYEYIDVNAGGNRYIVEVFLAVEFTIARPTGSYAALLDAFPPIFVGKPDELKQVVKLMCKAIRKSMKSVDLKLPPWRRLAYMQTKWFGPYKRTTNQTPSRKTTPFVKYDDEFRSSVGFAPALGSNPVYCRDHFAAKAGIRIGNLAVVLDSKEMA